MPLQHVALKWFPVSGERHAQKQGDKARLLNPKKCDALYRLHARYPAHDGISFLKTPTISKRVHQPRPRVTVDVLEMLLLRPENRNLMIEPEIELEVELLHDPHEGSEDSDMGRVGF